MPLDDVEAAGARLLQEVQKPAVTRDRMSNSETWLLGMVVTLVLLVRCASPQPVTLPTWANDQMVHSATGRGSRTTTAVSCGRRPA